jgi:hypothetical protein
MTAINMLRKRGCAIMMTDSAGYDQSGVVRCFYQKAIAIPHLRAAVAVRGSANAVALIAAAFGSRFSTFDDLVRGGGAVAEAVYDQFFSAMTQCGETELEIYLAGWSEGRERPETYFAFSADAPNRTVQDVDAWTFCEADDFTAAPLPSEEMLEKVGFRDRSAEAVRPSAGGLLVMEAQRKTEVDPRWLRNGHDKCFVVGGFVTLTEITRAGVSQRVIHRWDDEIDKPIQPAPANAFTSHV